MAGHIPREFIDQLLGRVDIIDVINKRVPLKKAGREYTACCPFHNEKTPSFTVSPTKQFFHCFGCGAHGSAISFLMEYDHLEYVEAIEALARNLGVEVPREQRGGPERPRKKLDNSLYGLMEETASHFMQQLGKSSKAVDYIKQRDLSHEIIQQYGIGYSTEEWDRLTQLFGQEYGQQKLLACGLQIKNGSGRVYDRFRDRLMFPIRDRRGRVIGFGGRVLGDDKPKYLNSPETDIFHKGTELYGLFEARNNTRKLTRFLVVEGYMDVIALAQFGITYAVATMGTATTMEHIGQLYKSGVSQVVFCFDGDRAGEEAAWKALKNALPAVNDDREIRFQFLPEGEDPDTLVRKLGKEGYEAELKKALPFSKFFIRGINEGLGLKAESTLHSIEDSSRFATEASRLLDQMPESLIKKSLLLEIQRLGHVTSGQPNAQEFPNEGQGRNKRFERGKFRKQFFEEKPQGAPTQPGDYEVKKTPVRYAITLLLNSPELVTEVGNPEKLLEWNIPGINLLFKLVETAEENPHIHSAGLMERFRGTEHEKILLKLMKWQPQEADMQILQQEFQDCFRQIKRQAHQKALESLLHKEQTQGLDLQEKHDLLSLLSDIHGSSE
uniref:DNA primase n=1 Tax=uncultured Thiotrichaceae bacterium TaxID=298394 RepID=A0A6S6RWH5_9GAMM|nr:MAG: DNA primase (EC [uncultured Thiotrichaceae bacterium]